MKKFVGIDISKATFDIYFEQEDKGCHVKLHQTKEDYKVLLHLIGKDSICIMEATGNYHLNLAKYLHQAGIKVVAENPLKIKRFSQMSLQRTQTDKADAKLIYEYGRLILSSTAPHLWQPDKVETGYLKQYDTVRNQLIKQRTALSNSEEALNALTSLNDEVTKVLDDMVTAVDKAIKQLDQGMLKLVKERYAETFDLVTSVPGVGTQTATMMICLTDGFKKFSHDQVKQFISYIGMSPRTFESGTRVKGHAHISKAGNSRMRSMLSMCSWTAKTKNQQCAALY